MFAKVKPNTQIIGQNIIYFNTVESTNSFALELLKQNMAEDGTVIIAEHQSKGRGQGQNQWISEPYLNLLFSIILQPVTMQAINPFTFNKAIAVAVCQTLQNLLPENDVKIKWPNDILVNSLKVAGILTENSFSGFHLKTCIAGIGINVNQDDSNLKPLYACSLKTWTGFDINREDLLKRVLEKIETAYLETLEERKNNINLTFDSLLYGIGEKQTFKIGQEQVEAYLCGCDKEGRLIIETAQNEKLAYLHGSIKQIIHA